MVYGLWCMVYGLWFMVYGLRFMVYGCSLSLSVSPSRRIHPPAPSKEETNPKLSRNFTLKPRPESGLDCLICAIFARQQLREVTATP